MRDQIQPEVMVPSLGRRVCPHPDVRLRPRPGLRGLVDSTSPVVTPKNFDNIKATRAARSPAKGKQP